MKKIFKNLIYLVFFGTLIFAFAGCKNSSFVLVDGSSFRGQVDDSEIFIDDLTGWEKIDEGFGDMYAHAQTQYKIKTDSI